MGVASVGRIDRPWSTSNVFSTGKTVKTSVYRSCTWPTRSLIASPASNRLPGNTKKNSESPTTIVRYGISPKFERGGCNGRGGRGFRLSVPNLECSSLWLPTGWLGLDWNLLARTQSSLSKPELTHCVSHAHRPRLNNTDLLGRTRRPVYYR